MTLPRVRLGARGPEVSTVALGSWRTFERLERSDALALVSHARARGINFLDDARYNDETGTAPIPSGYSEVLFGELFRDAGYERDATIVSEKLWWEFWPQQPAAEELAGSLERLRFDHVDVIYSTPLPDGLGVEQAVEEIAGLLEAGSARAWGVANWGATDLRRASAAAVRAGIDPPCAAQLPYSLVRRDWAEGEEMLEALREGGTGLVPSFVLEGGALTGKYAAAGASGRLAGELDEPAQQAALAAVPALTELAAEWETTPAALAIAFVLDHPCLASVLVGATSPAQLDGTLAGVELHARLGEDERRRLRAVSADA
jgi:aryl-alcohol dehydrogenase-like predicted oxidoreductase